MQFSSKSKQTTSPASWLGTISFFAVGLASLAAFALMRVEESRTFLIG